VLSAWLGFLSGFLGSFATSLLKQAVPSRPELSKNQDHDGTDRRGPLWLVIAAGYLIIAFAVAGEVLHWFSVRWEFLVIALIGGGAAEMLLYGLARRGKVNVEKTTAVDRFVEANRGEARGPRERNAEAETHE